MSASPSRVFVARLAGLAVFDPSGDQVGRVRDVVVVLGATRARAVGIVVEVPGRRRVFVPMTRITAMEPTQVITTGLVNMRRFEQRASETLVLAELLDRQLELGDGTGTVAIEDVGLEQVRGNDWVVTRLFVRRVRQGRAGRPAAGMLRRRGESFLVELDEVSSLVPDGGPQGAASLLAAFDELKPADLAEVLHAMAPKRRREVAAALDDEKLADVLEELPEDDQIDIVTGLQSERAADVLEAMEPDDAADLLSDLDEETAARLLAIMEPEEARQVRRLLAYDEDTAGGIMTSEPVILPARGDRGRGAGHGAPGRARPRHGGRGVRLPPPAGGADRPVPRRRAHPAAAARAPAVPAGQRGRPRPGGPADRRQAAVGEPAPGHLQPGVRAGRGRRRAPGRRGHRRRRPRPPAARRLARAGGPGRGGPQLRAAPGGRAGLHDGRGARRPPDRGDGGPAAPGQGQGRVSDTETGGRRERKDRSERKDRTAGLDTPRTRTGPRLRLRPDVDPESFGRGAERFARFMGTARFLVYMSAFVTVWLLWNTLAPVGRQFDPQALNYTLLTLILSLQASYAAPLILLAQNRQDDRDRVQNAQDRVAGERALADTEFLTREVADLKIALREVATRDFLRSELRTLLEELLDRQDEDDAARDGADDGPRERTRERSRERPRDGKRGKGKDKRDKPRPERAAVEAGPGPAPARPEATAGEDADAPVPVPVPVPVPDGPPAGPERLDQPLERHAQGSATDAGPPPQDLAATEDLARVHPEGLQSRP